MGRPLTTIFAAALAGAFGSAAAQDGGLSGVTMRVLDDVGDIDAVILELDGNRGEGEDSDAGEGDSAEREAEQAAEAEEERLDGRREREELHDPDDDERSEGRLEDNDVERPAVPPVP